ncbi:hypothetical protein C8F04DRAFT_91934 [Mycena alexandri]|uniref:Uncharacterized protein n=1 Tax=Mycena alexandri TaxID=1745969 RepID=A0AAD6SH18_9AGAR|nr:hypothetical protein C8F04DRAFT_91934 [Mycena alexandri]
MTQFAYGMWRLSAVNGKFISGLQIPSTWQMVPHGILTTVRNQVDDSNIFRVNATDVSETTFRLYFHDSRDGTTESSWLGQANHIFHRLQVIDNYVDYVVVAGVAFEVKILPSGVTLPKGYLFLCPPSAFQAGSSSLRWPDCPAYWSLDPLGVERLTAKEATRLGFPSMRLATSVYGYSSDASVYTGLRQFHAAKGFDPDSQDVARHLGYPLYELSGEMNVPFAHVVDEDPIKEVSSGVEDGR